MVYVVLGHFLVIPGNGSHLRPNLGVVGFPCKSLA